ncbi:extracellular solute-binding protein [Mesorhizobium sp. VK22B]|uniref:Extracellular solute-binding protein n=1 Tax=Mesorhizobium captivum TaxID=3072319 RepID=A0ABU4Z1I3_9HYPH|nr:MULTISPECIES: extracellular solute-binding protein [unclassified Mesorhizobium]MDX8493081.1 extracellular solute-binding protein [Mesorhizobium sp. VK22B]MDX8507673.1 extracellular solute-binding protein [Mesorhizobium sp. VK22E]
MPNGGNVGKFEYLVHQYLKGRIGRRDFILGGLQLGLSFTVLAKLAGPARAANLMDSAPAAPYESPVTKERVDFLNTKPFKGTTINVMVLKATVGDGLKYHVPHWEEETGGKINVAEVPIETLHQQIFSDLASGLGRYDAYMTGAWFYGDFFVPETPYIVEIDKFLSDPRYPYWDPNQWLPSMRKLYEWNGKLYGVLFDCDAQALYFRKDIFSDEKNKAKFKDKYGYALPNPPKTTKELHDAAAFFTGWDWNGDGSADYGLALHAKVNEQGFFHFLSLSAPYVVSPDNKYYFFNPKDMKPLINSEGHLRALEDYVKLAADGPREEISWTLGQGWNLFLAGHSAMEPTWGDLPTLAQDPKTSKVQGKMGAAGIPGTTDAFNPITGEWKKYELNQVGNTNGGSWHCVISSNSKKQEATYDFLAFMANKKNAFFNAANGWTGVQPGMKFEYLPPVGSASIDEFKAQGWNADDVKEYLTGYYSVLSALVQEEYLRIPGTAEYWHELDVNVSAVLGGQMQPKAALDATAAAWEKITDRYGRDKQKALYQASFA